MMTRLKLFGGIAALVAVIGAALWLLGVLRENDRLSAVEAGLKRCEAAAKAGTDPVADCPQAISDAVTRGQRYLACDAALAAGDLYTVRAACSAAVKNQEAAAAATAAELASLNAAFAALKRDAAAGIARAETRAATTARKEADARSALAAAQKAQGRGPADRVRCDDQCLRALTGH
jgi:hypothetical protein